MFQCCIDGAHLLSTGDGCHFVQLKETQEAPHPERQRKIESWFERSERFDGLVALFVDSLVKRIKLIDFL